MRRSPPTPEERLIGRDEPLDHIVRALERSRQGHRSLVLLAGEAGIGKTSLIRVATKSDALTGWGTGIDEAGAPGFWPWKVALAQIAERVGPAIDAALTAGIAPLLEGESDPFSPADDQHALREAARRWLDAAAETSPVVVVLDDLQWADESSVALLASIARAPGSACICLIAGYRQEELPARTKERLSELASIAVNIELKGLGRDAVESLLGEIVDDPSDDLVEDIYRRAGGHPVFTRELALLTGRGEQDQLPVAVRDAISRRLRSLPETTRAVLDPISLSASELHPGTLAEVLDEPVDKIETALRPALDARLIAIGDAGGLSFTHDLFRETVAASITPQSRSTIHLALGNALERRSNLGEEVRATELARHFCEAISSDGPKRALRWSIAAAREDQRTMAFLEAAAHLKRWRTSVADSGAKVEDPDLIEALLVEAEALGREGSAIQARGLLRSARDIAERSEAFEDLARIALAVTRLGAKFATRRDEVIQELEAAMGAVSGVNVALEAQVTAALARELQHSVASDRPRAEPLSIRALELGREAGDPETLAACLLARHDLLWTPGRAVERIEIAQAIVTTAEETGNVERRAEGLLLLANAQMESGSGASLHTLESSVALFEELGHPRHRYIALTRRAAIALLRGELEHAEGLIEDAAELGVRILEPDVDNVRMSQRLELVRTRNDPAELIRFASDAVAHWRGAPIHSNAVAAGFLARAGDLDGAKRHIATVLDLGAWSAERSYLWSVFMRELAVAAIALEDGELCRQLLDEILPLVGTCGVNGACVAFAGAHSHTAGLLSEALGLPSADLSREAAETYHRLGAPLWAEEVRALGDAASAGGRSLRRRSRSWDIAFDGEEVSVPHSKGLGDIATLIARAGQEVHVLELYGSKDASSASEEVVDRSALSAYRQRLADLDSEIAEAEDFNDPERVSRLRTEREALAAELRSVSGLHGSTRHFSNHPAERARKAVTARIRDFINRIGADAPRFAAHLDRHVTTGIYCRYLDETGARWEVSGHRV